jgi:hypothetical protein
MSIAHDKSTSNSSSASGTTISVSQVPVGTPDQAVAIVTQVGFDRTCTCTYGGSSMQLRVTSKSTSQYCSVFIFTHDSPSSGTQTCEATFSDTTTNRAITCITYTGSDWQSGNGTQTAYSDVNDYSPTLDILQDKANSFIVIGVCHMGGDTSPFSADNGENERGDLSTGAHAGNRDHGHWAADRFHGTATTYTHGCTGSAPDDWAIGAIEISVPAVGGTRRIMVVS